VNRHCWGGDDIIRLPDAGELFITPDPGNLLQKLFLFCCIAPIPVNGYRLNLYNLR